MPPRSLQYRWGHRNVFIFKDEKQGSAMSTRSVRAAPRAVGDGSKESCWKGPPGEPLLTMTM